MKSCMALVPAVVWLAGCAGGSPAPVSGPRDGWTQAEAPAGEDWGGKRAPTPMLAGWIRDEAPPRGAKPPAGVTFAEALHQVIQAQGRRLQRCYLEELKRDPFLYGELSVVFRLQERGAVEEARIDFSSLAGPGIEPCVLEVFRALEAPPPPRPGFRVRYPLVFTSRRTPPEVVEALQRRYQLPGDEGEEERATRKRSDDYIAPW